MEGGRKSEEGWNKEIEEGIEDRGITEEVAERLDDLMEDMLQDFTGKTRLNRI